MLFYWCLWIFFLFLSIKWKEKEFIRSYRFFITCIIILSLLIGGRENVGADWDSYKTYYETGYAYDKVSGHMEFLFEFVRNLCCYLHLSYGMFCFIISLISLLTLRKAFLLMDVKNCYMGFLVYLSLFFCNYQFNIVRHGLLASIVLLGMAYLSKGEKRKALLCIVISCGFHTMGILFIPLLFLLDKTLSRKLFIVILGISVIIYIGNLSGRIVAAFPFLSMIDRMNGYVDPSKNVVYSLSVGTLGFLAITAYVVFFRRKEYEQNGTIRIAANMLFLGFIVFCSLNAFSTIIQRVGNLLNLGTVILLPFIWQSYRKPHVKVLIRCLIILYLLLYYPKTWNVEDEFGNYSMIPFKTNITNLL